LGGRGDNVLKRAQVVSGVLRDGRRQARWRSSGGRGGVLSLRGRLGMLAPFDKRKVMHKVRRE